MASILFSLYTFYRTLPSKYPERSPSQDKTHSNAAPETKRFLAVGKSAVVYEIDSEPVVKEYRNHDGCDTEHTVYKRLSPHPNIARVLEMQADGSIVLERGAPLQCICRGPSANEIPLERKIRWLIQAAEG